MQKRYQFLSRFYILNIDEGSTSLDLFLGHISELIDHWNEISDGFHFLDILIVDDLS